jgi:MFS family permease
MLQFYFLSVAANFLAGATLSADWMSDRFSSLAGILGELSGRRARMITGLASLLVGVGTLFVPAGPPIILGDLFPSVVGMAVGVALLFEVLRQEALFPGEQTAPSDRIAKSPSAYRTALGAFGFAAAILHFFLPERLFL